MFNHVSFKEDIPFVPKFLVSDWTSVIKKMARLAVVKGQLAVTGPVKTGRVTRSQKMQTLKGERHGLDLSFPFTFIMNYDMLTIYSPPSAGSNRSRHPDH